MFNKQILSKEEESDGDSGHVVDDEETTSDGKKVRVRSHIREEQLVILRAHYALNPRPKKRGTLKYSRKNWVSCSSSASVVSKCTCS